MIFFLILTVRGPFHMKYFKQKKYGGTGLISEKLKHCKHNLMKEWEQLSVVILQQAIFYYLNHQKFQSRCLFNCWIFFRKNVLAILIIVTEQLYRSKILCGCFHSLWLWLLIAIMKGCTEQCPLQFYRASLIVTFKAI